MVFICRLDRNREFALQFFRVLLFYLYLKKKKLPNFQQFWVTHLNLEAKILGASETNIWQKIVLYCKWKCFNTVEIVI